ncbi:reductase [Pelistega indica]|uniref:Reductase n=1 Tax=Pelistega indica TaxID=1414851 RepID=V8GAG0_9BURK|nr:MULTISPECIES: Spx/MgsR family RNA polymerase-binding regulatory protein [Pelistega]ETD72933.1 reductase [Pelistega indica]
MSLHIYGLKNCSTCVKAQKWLSAQGVAFEFHDLRQQVPSFDELARWADNVGWDALINKKSQTWRQLTDVQKALTAPNDLSQLVQAYPSLLKRPLLENTQNNMMLLGFSEESYQSLLSSLTS